MDTSMKFIFLCIFSFASAQVETAEKVDSCNVVCNCNGGPSTDPVPQSHMLQGPPGKRGGKGETGRPGEKGRKGETGTKGQKGDEHDISMSAILSALSATGCEELKVKHGVNVNSYYPVRSENSSVMQSIYCDFTAYPDAENCDDLYEQHNITRPGYFMFGRNVATGIFNFCSPSITDIYTCEAMARKYLGFNGKSGLYEFKPRGREPFKVFCNFSRSAAVTTEIHHNLMTPDTRVTTRCTGPGCDYVTPTYEVIESNLLKIIENSVSCKQFVKLKCQGIQKDYTWWVSRNGEKMNYWGGSQRDGYCACGETNSCVKSSFKCNCDINDISITASDEGYLTDKTKLPVKEVRIGDLNDSGEEIWYTIGKLECSGQV